MGVTLKMSCDFKYFALRGKKTNKNDLGVVLVWCDALFDGCDTGCLFIHSGRPIDDLGGGYAQLMALALLTYQSVCRGNGYMNRHIIPYSSL